jgi:hypothetical protein
MFDWFKKKKQKEILNEISNSKVEKQATEADVEAIIQKVKKDIKKEKHIDCECKECIDRIKNA